MSTMGGGGQLLLTVKDGKSSFIIKKVLNVLGARKRKNRN